MPRCRRRAQLIHWEEVRQPGRQAGGLPPRRARRRTSSLTTGAISTLRALPDRPVRPARLRAAALRTRPLPDADLSGEHDLAPGRRHREAPRTDRGIDTLAGVRRVVGERVGPRLRRETIRSRVTELVLRGIFTLRRSELDWYYNGGAGEPGPPSGGGGFEAPSCPSRLQLEIRIAAFNELAVRPPTLRSTCRRGWHGPPGKRPRPRLEFDAAHVDEFLPARAFALAFARIENHYFVNAGWFRRGSADRRRGQASGTSRG